MSQQKRPTPEWQRLQMAEFGNSSVVTRPGFAVPRPKQPNAPAAPAAPTVDEEQEQAKGFTKGYEDGLVQGRMEGFAAGEAAGAAEGKQAAHQLLSLAANLDKALTDLDQEIADEILALGLEIARQMVRQAIAIKPEVILSVVRDALNELPHQHATIYLNPEDVQLVRNHSGDQISHAGHRIHEDTQLRRGDVVIEASGAQVDATLVTRWRRVVESLGSKATWIDDSKT